MGISKPMYKVCDCQGKNVKVIPKRPNLKVIPLRFLCVCLDLGMYETWLYINLGISQLNTMVIQPQIIAIVPQMAYHYCPVLVIVT